MSETINKTLDKIGLLFQQKKNLIQESKIIENPAPPVQLPSQMQDFQQQNSEDPGSLNQNVLRDKLQKLKNKEKEQKKKKDIKNEKIESKNPLNKAPIEAKNPLNIRKAAGEVWIDNSMSDWPENDYRLFVGNLGNEVTDTVLANAFRKYASFQRARVIRCKRSMKTKGYGFVSLSDANDYLKAFKEMNGKYVGNRPCKIVKSKWQERQGDEKTQVFNGDGLHAVFKKPPKIKKQKIKGFTTYAVDQNPFGMQ